MRLVEFHIVRGLELIQNPSKRPHANPTPDGIMLISSVEEELGSLSIGTAAEVAPTKGLRMTTVDLR
jgi:hypothetical protein